LSLIDPAVKDPKNLEPAAEDIRKLADYLKDYEFFDEIVILKDQDILLSEAQSLEDKGNCINLIWKGVISSGHKESLLH
jgi:hypothetical protein